MLLRFTLKIIKPPQLPAQMPLSKASLAALVGLAFLLPPLDSTALEWAAQPSISVGASANDNINLEPVPHGTAWGSIISPQLTLSVNSPQSSFSGKAQLNRLDYSDKSALSRTDGQLSLEFTRQYERALASLAGDLTRDSTFDSELPQTGVVTIRAQRTSRTLSPSWAYSINERDSISFAYNYLDVSYSSASASGSLLDYTEKDPSITLSHAFTEKNKLSLSLGYSDYQSLNPVSSNSQYRFTTTSTQLGFTRDFSETLSVSFMAGMHKTDSKVNFLGCLPFPGCPFSVPSETNSSTTGSLYKASIQQAFESSNLTAEIGRSLQPTADGGLVQTDRLSGAYGTKLTPTLSGSLNISIYKTLSDAVSRTSNDSRYYNIGPTIDWQITEWWTASTSYSRSVSQPKVGAKAVGNAINLTLNYNWPKISKSR